MYVFIVGIGEMGFDRLFVVEFGVGEGSENSDVEIEVEGNECVEEMLERGVGIGDCGLLLGYVWYIGYIGYFRYFRYVGEVVCIVWVICIVYYLSYYFYDRIFFFVRWYFIYRVW